MNRVWILAAIQSLAMGIVAQSDSAVFDMSLDDLFSMKVNSASGIEESYLDAPASMIVISAKDIEDRGYLSLDEIMMDLPGFDVNVSNGTTYLQAYQRGYRTPFTQRTLLMINGKNDNHLWSHMANISRQYPINNIERVEVLYGPASAVYGPNAFLGIINIITKDASEMDDETTKIESTIQYGSHHSHSADISASGRYGKLSFNVGARFFRSDEEDLSDKYGFASNDWYGNTDAWGPLLDHKLHGNQMGQYADPTDDWGVNGLVKLGNLTFGFINWQRREAYGAYYAADKAQNNTFWTYTSGQYFLDYNKELSEGHTLTTSLLHRNNSIDGGWAEATPMWNSEIHNFNGDTLLLSDRGLNNDDFANYSFISFTNWHSVNNSWKFKQDYHGQLTENIQLMAGLKYERKELTKAYDIPGYWGVFSSIAHPNNGPHNHGAAIGHSTDESYSFTDLPTARMPERNLIFTEDMGGYLQSSAQFNQFRFIGGVRYDRNSLYGVSINPRASAIYSLPSGNGVLKLVYGEAFQEPAPIQLFGGWNGRSANPDLKPEKARNLELIGMFTHKWFFHQISLYKADYENVIKEEAENAGTRKIAGLEYSMRANFFNPMSSKDIQVFLYYSYCHALSSVKYDFDEAAWVNEETELGDIAPHKLQAGLNVPISDKFNFNLKGQYIHDRTPYVRNALRADENYKIPGYFNVDGNFSCNIEKGSIGLKVKNLFNANYFYPGPESASAGNNFDQRSLGFHNSLIPAASRYIAAYIRIRY